MRRALQRCSSSFPRSLSAFSSTSRAAQESLRRPELARIATTTSYLNVRTFYPSLSLRQVAVAESSEPAEAASVNAPITRFEELGTRNVLHQNVVQTLVRDMQLETMTEVQSATINEALKGTDIIAQARTGTGKTMAFLLPILQRIINVDPHLAQRSGGRRGPRTTADDIRAIIISPTRELAEQIAAEAKRLTRNTGVIVQTAVGGTQKSAGLRAIQREGCHLLVGTPGRLKDLLTDPYSRVEAPDLSALVFDEADRLLDQGFWPEIQEIMHLLPTTKEKDRQTLMFSATVPKEVVQLVRSSLKPGFQFVKCVSDDDNPTHERVPQKIVKMNGLENSLPTMIEICQRGLDAAKEENSRPFKAIVYFNSTAEVSLAAAVLHGLSMPPPADAAGQEPSRYRGSMSPHPFGNARILEIHAKLNQSQRTRAAEEFRRCEQGILLSSDVTARGMDFPNVTHVIQMGLPSSKDQYVHRVGRTARAGKEGEGWLILNEMESAEGRSRLRNLPLQRDESLAIPKLDLTKPGDVPVLAGRILSMYQRSIKSVPMAEKAKVYLAQLGVHAFHSRKDELVKAMNNLSQYGWGLREPPFISPALASRLRIGNVPGVRVGHNDRSPSDDRDSHGGRSLYGDRGSGGRSSGGYGDRLLSDRPQRSQGYDNGGYGDRRGGRGGYDGGRSSSYGDRATMGGPPRDRAFGGKPSYSDPFA